MEKIYYTLLVVALSLIAFFGHAQNAHQELKEAESAYQNGNLKEARMALQSSLQAIDYEIARHVLSFVPENLGVLQAETHQDEINTVSAGVLGLFINRTYSGNENQSGSFDVVTDSPMITAVNAVLALPILGRDANQKRIRIGNYRALLQKSENSEGLVSFEVQIPMNNALVSFSTRGINDENQITAILEKIPLAKIAEILN